MVDNRTSLAPTIASQLEICGYKLHQRRDTRILDWRCSDSIYSNQSYIWSPFFKPMYVTSEIAWAFLNRNYDKYYIMWTLGDKGMIHKGFVI